MDTPLSQTTTTLKLEEIKRRCDELNNDPNGLLELTLEDAATQTDSSDPYNRLQP